MVIQKLGDFLPGPRTPERYGLLLDMANGALQAFQAGRLEEFDALVGENACQIRAVKVAMLYRAYNPTSFQGNLNPDDVFLIGSYILCKAKKTEREDLTLVEKEDITPLSREGCGNSFLRELVKKTRKVIAQASIQFVRSLATDPTSKRMCSEEFTIGQSMPMFWTYKTLLAVGLPIVFKAKFKDMEHLHCPSILSHS